jgi:hypothetical protein
MYRVTFVILCCGGWTERARARASSTGRCTVLRTGSFSGHRCCPDCTGLLRRLNACVCMCARGCVPFQILTHLTFVHTLCCHVTSVIFSFQLAWCCEQARCNVTIGQADSSQQVHYRVHTIPPLDCILSQINPVSTLLRYFCKMHFISAHPSTSRTSRSLSFRSVH